jgi:hypothetical protein
MPTTVVTHKFTWLSIAKSGNTKLSMQLCYVSVILTQVNRFLLIVTNFNRTLFNYCDLLS